MALHHGFFEVGELPTDSVDNSVDTIINCMAGKEKLVLLKKWIMKLLRQLHPLLFQMALRVQETQCRG